MKALDVISVFFSPNGSTARMANAVAGGIAASLSLPCRSVDITLPGMRESALSFEPTDIVVFALPVYAGRVPNFLLGYLSTLSGNSAIVIPVVVYGNRGYDDALKELSCILGSRAFLPVAAAAFAAQHCFSDTLAAGRPDAEDMEKAKSFAEAISQKLLGSEPSSAFDIPGDYPSRGYFQIGSADELKRFLGVRPAVSADCTGCMLCADVCPVGAISRSSPSEYVSKCVKCCACVNACPIHARAFTAPVFIAHKQQLEESCTVRCAPELFL